MNNFNYVIFHKGCLDGFSGFFILHTTGKIDSSALIYPDNPHATHIPPNIKNKNVIIIDVAYKYSILKEIIYLAKSVVFIDHHITIREDVLKLKSELKQDNLTIIYDEFKSGASLTWEYFFPKKKLPIFVRYVEDNDIGAWKMKHTQQFITGIQVKYSFDMSAKNLKLWEKLFKSAEIKDLIKKGKVYWEYIEDLLNTNAKRYTFEAFPSETIYEKYSDFFKKPGQYKVAVVCGGGCPSATLLGSHMMKTLKCDFVIMWNYQFDTKKYVLAFRSKKVNVGEIAFILSGDGTGGGHKLASACSFSSSTYNITDLFFKKSLPRI